MFGAARTIFAAPFCFTAWYLSALFYFRFGEFFKELLDNHLRIAKLREIQQTFAFDEADFGQVFDDQAEARGRILISQAPDLRTSASRGLNFSHCERGERIRIISARLATRRERKQYEEGIDSQER
jgi:uncharacterized DUF497 family protein